MPNGLLVPAARSSFWDLRGAHGHVAVADYAHVNVNGYVLGPSQKELEARGTSGAGARQSLQRSRGESLAIWFSESSAT